MDWKTTVTGIVAGFVIIARNFGFEVPAWVTDIVIGLAVIGLGYFAKDKLKKEG